MERVLLVEDGPAAIAMLRKKLVGELECTVSEARTYTEAVGLLEDRRNAFDLAVVGLKLSDAPVGAIVDLVVGKGIPTIVVTGEIADDIQDHVWSKHVVDYVLKEGDQCLDRVATLVRQLRRNPSVGILVVDDSAVTRRYLSTLLGVHRFPVYEAVDGSHALAVLEENPSIRLVLTDFAMPVMDGFELTKALRRKFRQEELAIIGISSYGNARMSARFLKHGADDFIHMPFSVDEFYCRIGQTVDSLEAIRTAREAANRDYLTGLCNRRLFFESARLALASSRRTGAPLAMAMIDADRFRGINDRHGHDAGDFVIAHIAQILTKRFRESDIVARFGGAEFCVLAQNMPPELATDIFDGVRKLIESNPAGIGKEAPVPVTVSIGVTVDQSASVDDFIQKAEEQLWAAKQAGRNRVACSFRPVPV